MATFSILGVLVTLYSVLVYHGATNCYEFLYKQRRYKNFLLTAFYTATISTCVCRITQYVYLITYYLATNQQHTQLFMCFDMLSNITMLCVGCVTVLFIISLMIGVQLLTQAR